LLLLLQLVAAMAWPPRKSVESNEAVRRVNRDLVGI
jgi:hypothetical protein